MRNFIKVFAWGIAFGAGCQIGKAIPVALSKVLMDDEPARKPYRPNTTYLHGVRTDYTNR